MTHTLLHQMDIKAPPKKVFAALTTRDGLAGFWTSEVQAEPRVGSVARFNFPGAPAPLRMRIDALEPDKRVAWTCLGDFPGWEGTTVSWLLSPAADGAGTSVLFRHGDVSAWPEPGIASVNYTWGQIAARLKGYSETGTPQPFLA